MLHIRGTMCSTNPNCDGAYGDVHAVPADGEMMTPWIHMRHCHPPATPSRAMARLCVVTAWQCPNPTLTWRDGDLRRQMFSVLDLPGGVSWDKGTKNMLAKIGAAAGACKHVGPKPHTAACSARLPFLDARHAHLLNLFALPLVHLFAALPLVPSTQPAPPRTTFSPHSRSSPAAPRTTFNSFPRSSHPCSSLAVSGGHARLPPPQPPPPQEDHPPPQKTEVWSAGVQFCPDKWAKVGGQLQMDGSVKFAPGETDY